MLLTAEKSCKGNIHTQRKIFTNLDVLTPVKSKLTHGGLEFTVSDCVHRFYRNIKGATLVKVRLFRNGFFFQRPNVRIRLYYSPWLGLIYYTC